MTKNGRNAAFGIVLVCTLAVMGGCTGANKTSGTMAQSTSSPQKTETSIIKGKVVETMNAAGYSYICLEKDGNKVWVAVPTMAVKVGDELELLPGFEQGPFTSKTLNKTFDQLIFSGGPFVNPAAQPGAMPAGHPGVPAMGSQKNAAAPAVNGATHEKPIYTGKVVETMVSGGYTYICLEKDGKKGWSAVPPTEVKVGDEIVIRPGTEMGTFTSRTLNRTFDNIVFSPGVAPKK